MQQENQEDILVWTYHALHDLNEVDTFQTNFSHSRHGDVTHSRILHRYRLNTAPDIICIFMNCLIVNLRFDKSDKVTHFFRDSFFAATNAKDIHFKTDYKLCDEPI